MILRLLRTEEDNSTPEPPTPTVGDPPPQPPPPQPPPNVIYGACTIPLYPVYSISVTEAYPYGTQNPGNYFYDVVQNRTPSGYAMETVGVPPPNWYLSPVLISFSSIDPGNPFDRTRYIPDPPDPNKCDIEPSWAFVGLQLPPPTVPGTVIEDTGGPTTGGGYPLPPQPPIIDDATCKVRNAITGMCEEPKKCYDRLTGQIRGLIDYGLDNAAPIIDKARSRIETNIVNTMGEVYSAAYPIGLGIPSTEQIITGEGVYSPYGIGASMPLYPDCDTVPPYTPTPTPTPTPSPTPTPTPTPSPTPTPTPTPTGDCPAPVVQCPDAPDITFAPNITINIPKPDGTNVTVNVEPQTGGGYPLPNDDSSSADQPSPSPSPTPSPTPTETPKDDKCPVLDPPKPPPVRTYQGLDSRNFPKIIGLWGDTKACTIGQNSSGEFKSLGDYFGYSIKGQLPSWIKSIEKLPLIGPDLAQVVNDVTVNTINAINQSTGYMTGDALAVGSSAILTQILSGIVSRWIGFDMTYFTRSSIYDLNFLNPQTIPSEADFVGLFLDGQINEGEFDCMVRANGSYPSWWRKIAHSQRTKPSVEQIIQLNRRGLIDDEETNIRLINLGVRSGTERGFFFKATEAMPTVSDIVRFMVRDADDKDVAAKYGTDAMLKEKYGPQLQSWARGQGITDEVMKYYWRSHWEIPSNTALFEMLHRLRPNRKTSPVPADAVVTIDDIKDALVVNDTLPYWARRMIEISYKPLTRTDTQRAYFIDALSEDELYDSYMDLGYNADNAARLVKFTNQLKARRKQAVGGSEKAASVLKFYKSWLISDTEATTRLKSGGLSDSAASDALQIARLTRKNDSQLTCMKGIKSQFRRYIIDDVEARHELTVLGFAIENITPMVNTWKCERATKPKELSAGQVCKAYQNNLFNDVEYRKRLQAIGYQEDEAGIMLELCIVAKGNKNDGKGDTTRIRTDAEKMAQTAAARAITEAAKIQANLP